jgi:hypothetical protein
VHTALRQGQPLSRVESKAQSADHSSHATMPDRGKKVCFDVEGT